jgi:hypothetical protein
VTDTFLIVRFVDALAPPSATDEIGLEAGFEKMTERWEVIPGGDENEPEVPAAALRDESHHLDVLPLPDGPALPLDATRLPDVILETRETEVNSDLPDEVSSQGMKGLSPLPFILAYPKLLAMKLTRTPTLYLSAASAS